MAVALPSAPGFFGPYHFACKVALERFGIVPETAVALGTLIHAVFWLSLTGLGLLPCGPDTPLLVKSKKSRCRRTTPESGKASPLNRR